MNSHQNMESKRCVLVIALRRCPLVSARCPRSRAVEAASIHAARAARAARAASMSARSISAARLCQRWQGWPSAASRRQVLGIKNVVNAFVSRFPEE